VLYCNEEEEREQEGMENGVWNAKSFL